MTPQSDLHRSSIRGIGGSLFHRDTSFPPREEANTFPPTIGRDDQSWTRTSRTRSPGFCVRHRHTIHSPTACHTHAHTLRTVLPPRFPTVGTLYGKSRNPNLAMDANAQLLLGYHLLMGRANGLGGISNGNTHMPSNQHEHQLNGNQVAPTLDAVRREQISMMTSSRETNSFFPNRIILRVRTFP